MRKTETSCNDVVLAPGSGSYPPRDLPTSRFFMREKVLQPLDWRRGADHQAAESKNRRSLSPSLHGKGQILTIICTFQ